MQLYKLTYTVTSPGHTPATLVTEIEAESLQEAKEALERDLVGHGNVLVDVQPHDVPDEKPAPATHEAPSAYAMLTDAQRRAYQEADVRRRVLVGARMSREQADTARMVASATGRSLYRFVMDAVGQEIERYDPALPFERKEEEHNI